MMYCPFLAFGVFVLVDGLASKAVLAKAIKSFAVKLMLLLKEVVCWISVFALLLWGPYAFIYVVESVMAFFG